MAGTVPMTGFEAASRHIANLAGVAASPSSLQRRSLALGEEALRFEREEAVEGKPLEPRMHLSIDGTGIPMRQEETEGVLGKHEDGSSKSREARLAVMHTAEGRDPETGAALKDRGSETSGGLIDSAAARSVSKEPSGFATRLDREALRRGLHDARELVVISDGAEWIRNTCDELFGGRKVTCVLDIFHALEHASDAVKAILPGGPGRQGGPGARALQRQARGGGCVLPPLPEQPREDAVRRVPRPGHAGRERRRGKRLQAVRTEAEALRHPPVQEGSQRHARPQELRHEPQAA